MSGMSGHERPNDGITNDWITPRGIIDDLGPFDLDPCASRTQPWPTAETMLTIDDDGLAEPWPDDAFVWLNPPYGRQVGAWLERLSQHPAGGIALVFARVETAVWHDHVWPHADLIAFPRGRLTFYRPDGTPGAGNSGAPSALIAYGLGAAVRLSGLRIPSVMVRHPTVRGVRV